MLDPAGKLTAISDRTVHGRRVAGGSSSASWPRAHDGGRRPRTRCSSGLQHSPAATRLVAIYPRRHPRARAVVQKPRDSRVSRTLRRRHERSGRSRPLPLCRASTSSSRARCGPSARPIAAGVDRHRKSRRWRGERMRRTSMAIRCCRPKAGATRSPNCWPARLGPRASKAARSRRSILRRSTITASTCRCADGCSIRSMCPGRLFSVNEATARRVPRLFARNERVLTLFEGEFGAFAVVLVGALNVGSIATVWAGDITPGRAARGDAHSRSRDRPREGRRTRALQHGLDGDLAVRSRPRPLASRCARRRSGAVRQVPGHRSREREPRGWRPTATLAALAAARHDARPRARVFRRARRVRGRDPHLERGRRERSADRILGHPRRAACRQPLT